MDATPSSLRAEGQQARAYKLPRNKFLHLDIWNILIVFFISCQQNIRIVHASSRNQRICHLHGATMEILLDINHRASRYILANLDNVYIPSRQLLHKAVHFLFIPHPLDELDIRYHGYAKWNAFMDYRPSLFISTEMPYQYIRIDDHLVLPFLSERTNSSTDSG